MSSPVVCPVCAASVPAGASICERCGSEIRSASSQGGSLKRPLAISIIAVIDGFFGLLTAAAAIGWFAAMAEMILDETLAVVGIGLLYLAIASLWIAAAIGLWLLKGWGRKLQIGLSVIGLLGFPIGTILFGLILFFLLRPGVKLLFSGREAGSFNDEERSTIAAVSSPVAALVAVGAVGLVSVFFCGLVAAIAVPNTINAVNRGRQKRTMSDMRSLATAVEAYAVDFGHYPLAIGSLDTLERFVSPDYIRVLPPQDGWEQPFIFSSNQDGTGYVVISYGRDGIEGPQPGGATSDYDCDIVWENGRFTQYPEGIQR